MQLKHVIILARVPVAPQPARGLARHPVAAPAGAGHLLKCRHGCLWTSSKVACKIPIHFEISRWLGWPELRRTLWRVLTGGPRGP